MFMFPALFFFLKVYKMPAGSKVFVYLQLVELQQVTVTSKRGQQTSLL